mmetsp:Transcript_7978/g.18529  ORF Transcript_7978/g.18529 Transcript_7978/m.18529 type:complete len:259 (-) Transcript_7978:1015-1791(-)
MIELVDLGLLGVDGLLRLCALVLLLRELVLQDLALLVDLLVFKMLLHESVVLGRDLLLELLNLMVHDLELALHLGNFILGLNKVLGVQVAVGPHGLVQVLLLLQLLLTLLNLLLEIHDRHLADLDLFQSLEVLGCGIGSLLAVLLALLLERVDHLALFLRFALVALNLDLQVLPGVFVDLHQVCLLLCGALSLPQVVLQQVSLAGHILDRLLVLLDLSPLQVDLTLKRRDIVTESITMLLHLNPLLLLLLDLLQQPVA